MGVRPLTDAAVERAPAEEREAELVERARGGDHDAYEALMRKHERAAFRTALLIVDSAADAEDVVQEAFVKAYRALGRFRPGAAFRPWLLRIVGNEARNHRRASGRREFHHRRAGALEPVPRAELPEDELLRRENRRRLLAAVDRLAPGERTAIVARYFVGLSDAEAAAALHVPRAAVKLRAWRGLQRLRRELAEGSDD
jgi:RNA polymerase sigma factor (sigma-70 family)